MTFIQHAGVSKRIRISQFSYAIQSLASQDFNYNILCVTFSN